MSFSLKTFCYFQSYAYYFYEEKMRVARRTSPCIVDVCWAGDTRLETRQFFYANDKFFRWLKETSGWRCSFRQIIMGNANDDYGIVIAWPKDDANVRDDMKLQRSFRLLSSRSWECCYQGCRLWEPNATLIKTAHVGIFSGFPNKKICKVILEVRVKRAI